MMRQAVQQRLKSKKILKILFAIVLFMFGFCYALVPLYNVMCKQLGLNGKTSGAVSYDASHSYIDKSRVVTVEFVTNTNESLPWKFYPNISKLDMHPGEMKRVTFYAENDTDHAMIVQAIPSVAPGVAARYLKKTECFCFTQQTLGGHKHANMPVLFHLDPELPKDVRTLTLSYTLFDITNRVVSSSRDKGRIG